MTSANLPSLHALRLVQELKNAIDEEEGVGHDTLTRRLPVASPDGRLAATYTVDLTLDYDGVYLASCREVSEVFLTANSEEQALRLACMAILEALLRRQKRPPSPA